MTDSRAPTDTHSPAARGAPDAGEVRDWLLGLQQRIVAGLETFDGGRFRRDAWQREPGSHATLGAGGGVSCVIEDSTVFERGAVLFSQVQGDRLPASAAGLSRPPACRWCCTRAIRTCPPCT